MSVMLRGHEMYVRVDEDQARLAGVRSRVGEREVHTEPGNPYCVVLWDDFRAPEPVLEAVSRDLATEALWLVWQKQVDAFGFQRWVSGQAVRRLAYGVWEKERVWETVEGEPQPWEDDAFFSKKRLALEVKLSEMYGGCTPDELRAIWRERRLVVDDDQPCLVAITAAYAVARHYSLPAWTL